TSRPDFCPVFAEKWGKKSITTEIADHDHVQEVLSEDVIVKRNLIADVIDPVQTIAGITLGEEHKSRSRRKSHSRSRSRDRRTRSRDRKHRSRDRKSRSRERKHSRERRWSRSRDRYRRSRSYDKSSRHRRSNSRERKRSRSGERQTSEATHTDTRQCSQKEEKQEDNRDLSKEIPGYESLTPAERIKAKIKLMVEKSKIPQPPSETFVPSPSQLASIESDAFEQVNFSSTRATGNSQGSSIGHDSSSGGRYNSTRVDASEYAPQVVELSSLSHEQESPFSIDTKKEVLVPEEERKTKWLKKLQLLREKHGH
ncbi:pre-mRNA-splicing factor 38B-like, partial [Halichondria panicea]|uniref:pre-mRNA-splicing factor 38B-like n=1 Tax=Halichondria panicea TaxID=6063 RepID=UPI00312BB98C